MTIMKSLLAFSATLLLLIMSAPVSLANASQSNSTLNIPFSVTPVIEKNQVSGVTGYIDLNVQPGQTETVHIILTNPTNHSVLLQAKPTNALTMNNGGVEYVQQTTMGADTLLDASYALGNKISLRNTYSIPANRSVTVPVIIHVPNVKSGSYLGGIVFRTNAMGNSALSPSAHSKATYTIKNVMNFAMAVQLNLPIPQSTQFSFGAASVSVITSGSQFEIVMKNSSGKVLQDVQGTYQITSKNNSQMVMEGQFGSFTMAPETEIQYPVLRRGILSPGTYQVKLTSNYGDAVHGITVQREFSIGLGIWLNTRMSQGRPRFHFTFHRGFGG